MKQPSEMFPVISRTFGNKFPEYSQDIAGIFPEIFLFLRLISIDVAEIPILKIFFSCNFISGF